MGELTINDLVDIETSAIFPKLADKVQETTLIGNPWLDNEVYVAVPEQDVNKLQEYINSTFVTAHKTAYPDSAGVEPKDYLADDFMMEGRTDHVLLYLFNDDLEMEGRTDLVFEFSYHNDLEDELILSGVSYQSSEDGIHVVHVGVVDLNIVTHRALNPSMQLFASLMENYSSE